MLKHFIHSECNVRVAEQPEQICLVLWPWVHLQVATPARPGLPFVQWDCGVARICCEEGLSWKLCHVALAANFRALCSSCSMTNSLVTNAVLMERAELLTSASADLTDYTIFG